MHRICLLRPNPKFARFLATSSPESCPRSGWARINRLAGATRRLIGDLFRLRDLGRQAVKGFADPVEAFVVKGVASTESRFEAARRRITDLVGRAAESKQLRDHLREAWPAPARSSCSQARPASASRDSPLSSPPRSQTSRTRGCAINARPITATASCIPLSCNWGAPLTSPPRTSPRWHQRRRGSSRQNRNAR
jgi:hypothetical protein